VVDQLRRRACAHRRDACGEAPPARLPGGGTSLHGTTVERRCVCVWGGAAELSRGCAFRSDLGRSRVMISGDLGRRRALPLCHRACEPALGPKGARLLHERLAHLKERGLEVTPTSALAAAHKRRMRAAHCAMRQLLLQSVDCSRVISCELRRLGQPLRRGLGWSEAASACREWFSSATSEPAGMRWPARSMSASTYGGVEEGCRAVGLVQARAGAASSGASLTEEMTSAGVSR